MKKICLIILLSVICVVSNAQTIEMNYTFNMPRLTTIEEYEQIQLGGCMQLARAGQPILPWQSISLMLPQGQEAESIEVILSDFQELEGSHEIYPYQPSRTYSNPERRSFIKDESIYSSKAVYPSKSYSQVSTQYLNGIGFAFSSFTPVQYEPATGRVRCATKAHVVVHTTASRSYDSQMLWLTPDNINRAQRLAQNPEMISTYQGRDGLPSYEILLVTKQQYIDALQDYADFYELRGLRTYIVAIEDVLSTTDGRDDAEKLRNFIIQQYQVNGIQMVNLAGDVPDIPYRGFYCLVHGGSGDEEDSGIPADLYYAGLDGTWNDDNDNRWGEIGEDDLLPEIGIGRMCFSDETELDNMMHKLTAYQDMPVLGEFRKVVMAGEHLYDSPLSNGSQYLEMLVGTHDENGYTTTGIPADYDFTRLYYETGNWSASNLRAAINQGTQYVHHEGHANTSTVANWYNSDITDENFSGANGVDHNYTFFHTSGCICGDFSSNCILERMTKIANFAAATIGNSRYGWFNEGQTEGPAIHLHRETEDAYYHDRIPQAGLALTEAKIQTAPFVNAADQWEEGALRWNFYDINVLGDVAICPWHDEPFTPEVSYSNEIMVGLSNTEVSVFDGSGNGLKNFRCAIFYEGEMIGLGYTNEAGVAMIDFGDPIDFVGELSLVVTGSDAWPQAFEINTIPDNTPYVVYNAYALNDGSEQIDFGGVYAFDMTFKNVGLVNANNVEAILSCESDYITINQAIANIGNIGGNQLVTLEDAFAFSVSNDVPDNTLLRFDLICTDGNEFWASHFNVRAHAPLFELVSATMESSTGSYLSPGDNGTVHFVFKNNGSATTPAARFNVYNSHPEISLPETQWNYDAIAPGEEFTADMNFTLGSDAEDGALYELPYAVQHGQYVLFDSYYVAVGQSMEDFETGDFSAFDWRFSNILYAWEIDNTNPYEGSYCAKSAAIGDYESSIIYIDLDVNLDSYVSFHYKVSSEPSYDKLNFVIDNDIKGSWSGEEGWAEASYPLTPGTHRLEWQYKKDVSMLSGSDCAWIDNIVFPASRIITMASEVVSHGMALYPNPNHGDFSISLPEEDCDIMVTNSLGQVVHRSTGNGLTTIHLNDLSKGLYFVTVKSASLSTTQKIIKE